METGEQEGREMGTDGHHWTESRDLELGPGPGPGTGRDFAVRDRKGQTGQDRQGRRGLGKRLQHKANSLQPV